MSEVKKTFICCSKGDPTSSIRIMPRSLSLRLFSSICLLFLILGIQISQAYSQDEFVYSIEISNCKFEPQRRQQTGFRVRGVPGIITALHGVIDAGDIRAVGSTDSVPIRGKLIIGKVDVLRDVALLLPAEASLRENLPVDGFEPVNNPDWSNLDKVTVYGYPQNLLDIISTTLSLRVPKTRDLLSFLPPKDRSAFNTRKSPDPSIKVVSIQGTLLPGHSGAPILDSRNRIIAIGDGGLNGGYSEICWAIPWGDVKLEEAVSNGKLRQLSESPPSLLFSFSVPINPEGDSPVEITESSPNLTQSNANFLYTVKNTGNKTANNVSVEIVIWNSDKIELNFGQNAGVTIDRVKIREDFPVEKAFINIKRLVADDEVIFTVISSRKIFEDYQTLVNLPVVNSIIYDQGKGNYVPFEPKSRLYVGGGLPVGYNIKRIRNIVSIEVVDGDWGAAQREDIQAVLLSAATEILNFFPEVNLNPILIKPSNTVPRLLTQKGPNGEYVILLSAKDRYWANFAYQFSSRFCQVLIDNNKTKNVHSSNQWFDNSLCQAVSVFTLRRMAESWSKTPPYSNWQDYAESLKKYADTSSVMSATLPEDKSFTQWYEENRESLDEDPYLWDKNHIVAGQLLSLIEKNPESLESVKYLNSGGARPAIGLKNYLDEWYVQSPEKHRAFVDSIRKLFGF